MSIKDKTIKELETLATDDVRIIYDVIRSLKKKKRPEKNDKTDYLEVRKVLKSIKGELSSDIIEERKERV